MNKLNKKLISIYVIVAGFLLGAIFIGLNRPSVVSDLFEQKEILRLTQDVFEYGQGYISIPIYTYVENEDDFVSIKSDPITISNKAIGKHEVTFTLRTKDKKQDFSVIKIIEIRDTQPPKIYPNNSWVNSDYCGPVLASVMDPVDGLLDYKDNLADTDYGYYTTYRTANKRVIKAIDKNGNISELSIDNYSGTSESNITLTEPEVQENACNIGAGFDGVLYKTQEQAIEAARNYLSLYQAQSNAPKSFNVMVTHCNNTTYYIWDFIW